MLYVFAGKTAPIKKRGAVKTRKKEPAAAPKKGTRGNGRAAVPTSNPSAPQEVVAEGGIATGKEQRDAPAASSAGPVAGSDHTEAAAALEAQPPTSGAAQQGQPSL